MNNNKKRNTNCYLKTSIEYKSQKKYFEDKSYNKNTGKNTKFNYHNSIQLIPTNYTNKWLLLCYAVMAAPERRARNHAHSFTAPRTQRTETQGPTQVLISFVGQILAHIFKFFRL